MFFPQCVLPGSEMTAGDFHLKEGEIRNCPPPEIFILPTKHSWELPMPLPSSRSPLSLETIPWEIIWGDSRQRSNMLRLFSGQRDAETCWESSVCNAHMSSDVSSPYRVTLVTAGSRMTLRLASIWTRFGPVWSRRRPIHIWAPLGLKLFPAHTINLTWHWVRSGKNQWDQPAVALIFLHQCF